MPAGDGAFPAISPDEHTIAYAAGEKGHDIVEVPLDGSGIRDVIATPMIEVTPSWSPDGTRFAYVTDRSGMQEIWVRNRLDGSEHPMPVPRAFGSPQFQTILDCAFSPDGSRVAYRMETPDATEIWTSLLSGEAPARLWQDPAKAFQRGPSWSPDGNWIAYYSIRDGKPAVLKIRVGAGQPELVTYTSGPQPVRWSPRGDWIAFRDGGALRLLSPDGKQERIVSPKSWETYGWSADGASLYGIAIRDHRLLLGHIDLASGQETRVADLGPVPASLDYANFRSEFPIRGFSMHPNGKSFLTSIYRSRSQIYLLRDFDRRTRLLDWFR